MGSITASISSQKTHFMKYTAIGLLLCFSFISNNSRAQDNNSSDNTQGIGVHIGAYDFYGPETHKYFTDKKYNVTQNVETMAQDTTSKNTFRWNPLVRFTYWYKLNKVIDFNFGLSLGNVDYPTSSKDSVVISRTQYGETKYRVLLAELDARINFNILPKEDYIISPYVFAGITGSHHPPYFGADVPLGVGFNFNLSKDHNLFLNLESCYKIAATDHDQNHLQHSAGFVYWFKPHYHIAKDVMPNYDTSLVRTKVVDSDGDGIPDDKDECPSIPGLAQFNGCPDSDGDGIPDNKDECPLVAGLAQFNGCPDSDGDGIPDQKDKCPYVAGLPEFGGCPPPDADHDGVPDNIDKCPNVAGPASNNGCPEIRKEVITQVEKAAKAIFFETGKATIKKISFAQLDVVVRVMKQDPSLYADIEGHTDNTVPKTYTNMELSQKRAEAVRDYFAGKGIDSSRMTAQGFGDTQPIAENKTAAGKAQNRRTVIKLRNFVK